MDHLKAEECNASGLPRSFRGYDRAATDGLLAKAAGEISFLTEQLASSKDRVLVLVKTLESFQSQETLLRDALVNAQRSADETRSNALRQADAILEEARKRASEMEAEFHARLNDLRWEYERLSIDKQRFTEKFRSLLEEYLASLVSDQRSAADRPTGNGGARHPRSGDLGPSPAFVTVGAKEVSADQSESEGDITKQEPIAIPAPYSGDE